MYRKNLQDNVDRKNQTSYKQRVYLQMLVVAGNADCVLQIRVQ